MKRKKTESIGALDTLITIQRKSVTENEYSEKEETWTDLLGVWANVEYPITKSNEEYADVINVAQRSIIFEVRSTDVTTLDRISFDGMFFDINAIDKDRLNARYKLHCVSTR